MVCLWFPPKAVSQPWLFWQAHGLEVVRKPAAAQPGHSTPCRQISRGLITSPEAQRDLSPPQNHRERLSLSIAPNHRADHKTRCFDIAPPTSHVRDVWPQPGNTAYPGEIPRLLFCSLIGFLGCQNGRGSLQIKPCLKPRSPLQSLSFEGSHFGRQRGTATQSQKL